MKARRVPSDRETVGHKMMMTAKQAVFRTLDAKRSQNGPFGWKVPADKFGYEFVDRPALLLQSPIRAACKGTRLRGEKQAQQFISLQ